MKLKDKKIAKFNVLDISITFIIVIFIAIFAFSKLGQVEDKNDIEVNNNVSTNFKYTFLVEALSNTSKEMFQVGDEVYDKVSNVSIGKISNLEITDALGQIDKTNGEIIKSPIPGKIDVKITVEANGSIKNGEYLASDLIRIMVGSSKQIKTKYVMCTGTVISINK